MWHEIVWITMIARKVWLGLGRREKIGLWLALLLMPVGGLLMNIPAIVVGHLVDYMLTSASKDFQKTVPYIVAIAAVIVCREVIAVVRKYLVENTCTRIQKLKTVDAMAHLLRVDLTAFGPEQRVGSIQGRMYRSIEGFVKVIKLCFLDFLPAVITAACALGVVFYRNQMLALIMGSVIPTGLALALLQMKTQKGIRIAVLRAKEDIDGRVVELLGGLEYIRAANTESHEVSKVDTSCEYLRQREIKHHLWMAIFDGLKYLNEGLFHILVLGITIHLACAGFSSIGDVLAYSVLFTAVVAPLREVHRILDEAHESALRTNDLFEILARPEDVSYSIGSPEFSPSYALGIKGDPEMEIRQIVYRYPGGNQDRPELNRITAKVRKGETVGIVGPSGSGKSTLIKVLLRLLHPTSGDVKINGTPLSSMARSDIASTFGYVSQNPFLFAGSVAENIAYGCGAVMHDQIVEAATKARIHDEIKALPGGYQSLVSERGANLSGGQRQRIAIARVFLKDSPILIFDEATSALDHLNEKAVQAALEEVRSGRTQLIVAHRLSTLRGADRILVLRDGAVVEDGSYQELSNRQGVFAELLGAIATSAAA